MRRAPSTVSLLVAETGRAREGSAIAYVQRGGPERGVGQGGGGHGTCDGGLNAEGSGWVKRDSVNRKNTRGRMLKHLSLLEAGAAAAAAVCDNDEDTRPPASANPCCQVSAPGRTLLGLSSKALTSGQIRYHRRVRFARPRTVCRVSSS